MLAIMVPIGMLIQIMTGTHHQLSRKIFLTVVDVLSATGAYHQNETCTGVMSGLSVIGIEMTEAIDDVTS